MRKLEVLEDLRDIKEMQWSPEIAIPLINTRLGLSDLIQQAGSEMVEVDEQGLIHLVYRGELISVDANEVLHIGDQEFEHVLVLSPSEAALFQSSDSVFLKRQFLLDYDVTFGEIDSVYMRYVKMKHTLSKNFDHDVELDIQFPDIFKQGVPFNTALSAAASTNSTNSELHLFNSFMDMSKGGMGNNQLRVELSAKIRKNGSSALPAGTELILHQSLEDHDFDLFYGYTGQEELLQSGADTMVLNVFDKSSRGTFTVDDPRIKLHISNSYGIPAEAQIIQLRTYATSTGFLNVTGFPAIINVAAPGQNQVGELREDSIVLNKQTSNIAAIINSKPEKLIYEFYGIGNPQGNTRRNFAKRNSSLKFRLDLDFPLRGTADDYAMEQETAFEFDEGEGAEFEKLVMRLTLRNEFPIDLDFQIYFLSPAGQVLDSLFVGNKLLLSSPPVDQDGRTQQAVQSIHDIDFGPERIDHLRASDKIRMVAAFNTTKEGSLQPQVAFYDDYDLEVQLGVATAIKLKVK